jgi:hypothetical protein
MQSRQEYLDLNDKDVQMTEEQKQEVADYLKTVEIDEVLTAKAHVAGRALQYLTSTDWYAIRLAETGIPIPEDVVLARAEAREKASA